MIKHKTATSKRTCDQEMFGSFKTRKTLNTDRGFRMIEVFSINMFDIL